MGFLESTKFLIIPYIVFAIFIGFLGREKKIGNVKAAPLLVIISLTLTPLVGLIFLFLAKYPNPFEEEKKYLPKQYSCRHCGWKFNHKFEFCPHCNEPADSKKEKNN